MAKYAAKKGATPSWGDKAAIEEFYKAAQLLTKLTGTKWQVDHIVPLRHPLVQGLHVEFNLQVIPAEQNNKKNNKWWPDTP